MRGMILAAGRGERMGSLTTDIPKPLLKIKGKYLIEYSLQAFMQAGIKEIVINVSYKKDLIKATLGKGEKWGVDIVYSEEETALETGGGVFQALPLLGSKPFVVISSDIISHYPLQNLPKEPEQLAHLILVNNPPFHPVGDFSLQANYVSEPLSSTFTFANIGIYRPEFFENVLPGRFPLRDLFKKYLPYQKLTGELFQGVWHNMGTPNDLANF